MVIFMAAAESYTGKIRSKLLEKQSIIEAATGRKKAGVVLKNATFVNVFTNALMTCDIAVENGRIAGLGSYEGEKEYDMTGKIVCPGFVDAHIHLESSLVCPREFVKATLVHGTTCVVTDPHEITNVMGTDGIDYMLQATQSLPIDVRFMLPSCVPATPLDEAGDDLDYRAIDSFFDHPRVLGLAEMMNAFGVVHNDPQVLSKIAASQAHGKQIDGHAPGLAGNELNAYAAAGVYSDHECSALEDALEKLKRGQFIMIREGTAARNLEALSALLTPQYAERCMFCTDDKHPSDLLELGHIDYICRRAINDFGADPILTVKVASHYAAQYFRMSDRGAIAPGYLADFAVIDNFKDFCVQMVFKCGELFWDGRTLKDFPAPEIDADLSARAHDTFRVAKLQPEDFCCTGSRGVIGMVAGQIVTTDNGRADHADPEKDILKIAVIERHRGTGHIGLGYLQGYGLRRGAVATSISHDSHNLIVVGTNERDMAFAANRVVENCGGITVVENGQVKGNVQLEIAGLMSDRPLTEMNDALEAAKKAAFDLGVNEGIDPFMTLSFMSLPVIPTLRLTTRGVIDVLTQQYI